MCRQVVRAEGKQVIAEVMERTAEARECRSGTRDRHFDELIIPKSNVTTVANWVIWQVGVCTQTGMRADEREPTRQRERKQQNLLVRQVLLLNMKSILHHLTSFIGTQIRAPRLI